MSELFTTKLPITEDQISLQRDNLNSTDPERQLSATVFFRTLISGSNPPIDDVIKIGVVRQFVHFLKDDRYQALQYESAWVLTNIASGSSAQLEHILELNAAPPLVRLLLSPNEDVREQSLWALSNIAGDSVIHRELLLALDIVNVLTESQRMYGGATRVSANRTMAWTVSNLVRGKPRPEIECIEPLLGVLASLLLSQDAETIKDTCWGLSYIADGSPDNVQAVLDSGVGPRLVQLLSATNVDVQLAALRTVGNIITGDDEQTDYMLSLNLLPKLNAKLNGHRMNVSKEAMWIISNITAGTVEQVQRIYDSNTINHVLNILRGTGGGGSNDEGVVKEGIYAVCNITDRGSEEQIDILVQRGLISILGKLLACSNAAMAVVMLESLDRIFKLSKSAEYIAKFRGSDGMKALYQLLFKYNDYNVASRAERILSQVEDEATDEATDTLKRTVIG